MSHYDILDVKKWVEDNHTYRRTLFENGQTHYERNGLLHREGGPAVEYGDGSYDWYYNGLLHRDDGGPAVYRRCSNRDFLLYNKRAHCEFWTHGRRNRLDGPAVEYPDHTTEHFIDGLRTK